MEFFCGSPFGTRSWEFLWMKLAFGYGRWLLSLEAKFLIGTLKPLPYDGQVDSSHWVLSIMSEWLPFCFCVNQ